MHTYLNGCTNVKTRGQGTQLAIRMSRSARGVVHTFKNYSAPKLSSSLSQGVSGKLGVTVGDLSADGVSPL